MIALRVPSDSITTTKSTKVVVTCKNFASEVSFLKDVSISNIFSVDGG